MKLLYRRSASADVIRQFRYYFTTENSPGLAIRFREAVRLTIASLGQHPLVGPRYRSSNPQLQDMRSWPVAGFEAIRIYYIPSNNLIQIIRILHGKRDLKRILDGEKIS